MKKKKKEQVEEIWKIIAAIFIFIIVLLIVLLYGSRLVSQAELKELRGKTDKLMTEIQERCLAADLKDYHFIIESNRIVNSDVIFESALPQNGEILVDANCEVALAIYDSNRNCVIKDYDESLGSFRAKKLASCVINQENNNYCTYQCKLLGEKLAVLVEEIFVDGMQINQLPLLDEELIERLNYNMRIEVKNAIEFDDFVGYVLGVNGDNITVYKGRYSYHPYEIEDIVDFGTEIIMITFNKYVDELDYEINPDYYNDHGIFQQEYVWVFFVENGHVNCSRVALNVIVDE